MNCIKFTCFIGFLFFTIHTYACGKKHTNSPDFSDSVISIKLNKTITYFQKIGKDKLQVDVNIILPYLEKKFNFKVFEKSYEYNTDSLPLLYRYIWVYEPGNYWNLASQQLKDSTAVLLDNEYKNSTIDAHTAYACLCDNITLPKNYFQSLDWKIKMNGYELTHTALQYKNLSIKKCINDKEYAVKKREISKRMMENILLTDPAYTIVIDLKIEAAVFLYYLESSIIKQKKIQTIFSSLLEYQDSSGGWKSGPDNNISQHTSLLALWWLLEMKENK